MEILIATGNKHKIEEIRKIMSGSELNFRDLTEYKNIPDVIEDGDTLEYNAEKKAKEYFEFTKLPCIADDSGLFVTALNGEPGVYSARYSGEDATYATNRILLLKNLTGKKDRTAKFRTVICYFSGKEEPEFFEGSIGGVILENVQGDNGFGYDPLFVPDGYDKTFAEMDEELKNSISHRKRALENFKKWWEKK